MDLDPRHLHDCVQRALAEDLGQQGDITARASVPSDRRGRARIRAKADGVLAGIAAAAACFAARDPDARVAPQRGDGDALAAGDVVLTVEGRAVALLEAERTALNFLQHLSGIATRTRAFVQAVAGTGAVILDTRKTAPGLRALQKLAVRAGGGHNHRHGLYDQVLLKSNHFALAAPRSFADVVRAAVAAAAATAAAAACDAVSGRRGDATGAQPVIAEARDVGEAVAAVEGGAGVVLLDNFAPGPALREAVQAVRGAAALAGRPVLVEASGGVRLENVRAFAECGVDRISVGALTHSVEALDLSMQVEPA